MFHFELSGRHEQMGRAQGLLFQKIGLSFPLCLDAFQLEHGKRSEELLRRVFPEVCEEIRGVSETVGVDYLTFASWMLCMGCCMYNLEKNIPVEIRGCTAFAYSKGGRIIYGRNNDLPPFLKKGSKRVLYAPEGGNRFSLTTSSFINGEEGLNEHGLAVAMTFVMTDPKKIRPGLNSCFLVRYLLEKAHDTKEAISLLAELPVSSNCNILIADPTGAMAVVECTPDRKKIREPEMFSCGSIVCTVNSFTSDTMKTFEFFCGNDYDSAKRYQTVMDSFPDRIREDFLETTKNLLKGDYGFLCQYDQEPDFETVWSSIFDLKSRMIYRAEGDPRKEPFLVDSGLLDSET